MDMSSKKAESDPFELWRYSPNRIELILMNVLLTKAKVKLNDGAEDKEKRTPIIYAARFGHVYALSRLLHSKASVYWTDSSDKTALAHAVENGHIEASEMLIRAGASITTTDDLFNTPLHAALMRGDESMAMMLIQASASINAYNCESQTPVMLVMEMSSRRLLGALVEHGADMDALDKRGWNVLIYAIENDMLPEIFPILLALGETRAMRVIRHHDPQGRNSMHHAVELRDSKMSDKAVDLLSKLDLEAAAIGDCNGETSVHLAAQLGRLKTVRKLAKGLGSAEINNKTEETPLMYAARAGHLAVVVALLTDSGNKEPLSYSSSVDAEGKTVLMNACISGNLDMVNMFLQNRNDLGDHQQLLFDGPLEINRADQYGSTALMVAAQEGHWHLLPSLVLAGASLAAKDEDGFNALHWAAAADESLAALTLLDLGLDPNHEDSKGWTALMHAADKSCDQVVQVLVDNDADLDKRNWDGDTAVLICVKRKDAASKSTQDIILDGVLARDCASRYAIPAKGHFMVSVLKAENLWQEGVVNDVNAYVAIQFCPCSGASPLAAFTSCVMSSINPTFDEVFRFDTEILDSNGYLIAWVMSAPGNSEEEVKHATYFSLTEAQLKELRVMHEVTGKAPKQHHPDFATDMQRAFAHLMHREDKEEDKRELQRLHDRAAGVAASRERDQIPYAERRWMQVDNLRQMFSRAGGSRVEYPAPMVPQSHLPLGCVLVSFRQLRAAVWSKEPVSVRRRMRLANRGWLHIEVDFRPLFFQALDPFEQRSQAHGEDAQKAKAGEEGWMHTPRDDEPSDDDADEGRPLVLGEDGPGGGGMPGLRVHPLPHFRPHGGAEELYKAYNQMQTWSKHVLQAERCVVDSETSSRRRLKLNASEVEEEDEEEETRGRVKKAPKEYVDPDAPLQALATVVTKAGEEESKEESKEKQLRATRKADAFRKVPELSLPFWADRYVDSTRFA